MSPNHPRHHEIPPTSPLPPCLEPTHFTACGFVPTLPSSSLTRSTRFFFFEAPGEKFDTSLFSSTDSVLSLLCRWPFFLAPLQRAFHRFFLVSTHHSPLLLGRLSRTDRVDPPLLLPVIGLSGVSPKFDRFYFDPLASLFVLAGLFRLYAPPCTISPEPSSPHRLPPPSRPEDDGPRASTATPTAFSMTTPGSRSQSDG